MLPVGHCRQRWDSAGKVGSCRQNPNGFRQHPGVAGSPGRLNNSCRGMARYPNYPGRIRSRRQLPVENAFLLMPAGSGLSAMPSAGPYPQTPPFMRLLSH